MRYLEWGRSGSIWEKEHVKWYGKCVESLFLGHKDSWVCRKVVELSSRIEKKPKEEIIRVSGYH